MNICCTAEELKSSKTPCLRKTQRNIGTPVTPCRWSEIFCCAAELVSGNMELSQSAHCLYDKAPLSPDPCKQESSHAEIKWQKVADRHILWACVLPNARAKLLWQLKLIKVNRCRGCNDSNYESFNILLNYINCWCLINEGKWPQIITG